ncbi:MAG: hypothetical protein ABI222_01565 [Opitutaceae bacterium]
MFNRQARPGALINQTDNFVQLARLVRMDEKPLHVDSLAEIEPNDEEALSRWLEANFKDYTGTGFLPTYCGFHPAQRVLVRENLYSRRFSDPAYLTGLVAEQAKVASAREWHVIALHPSEGLALTSDGVARPGLLFGVPWSVIREQQQRLLKIGLRPRRLEIGTLALLGTLNRQLARTGFMNSIVACEIEHSQTRTYVVAKDGVHTLPPLPHGLLSIMESAMKELGAPDVATARRQLEDAPEAIRTHGRRFVRVLSRHLKPAIDHFELRTGQRIETFFFSQLPTRLEWLGQALGAAVELEVLIPNFEAWLPTAGLKVDPGSTILSSSWLETFSLVSQLAVLPNEQKS